MLAYPAITLISNANPDSKFTFSELTSITQLGKDTGRLLPAPVSADWSSVFNRVRDDDTLVTIEEMGFMVGIGVATGADSVFIAKDLLSKVEEELLIPALNARDLSGNRLIFVDDGHFYPQHNLYYIKGGTLRELQLISVMLMSDYVKGQLLSITNCMNGGYPRWQSQYLRKLVMPDVNAIEESLAEHLLGAYRAFDLTGINDTMADIVSTPRSKSHSYFASFNNLSILNVKV